MTARSLFSVRRALLAKSGEAALTAVQTYNNPLTRFKSETYIVLMTIAWTYLLHAFYRREGVEYRYHERKRKRRTFKRTDSGGFLYWDLTECITAAECPLDSGTTNNLKFLIGLRNEIEHHMPPGLDEYLGSRYLACALNYEYWLTTLFGLRFSLGETVAMAIQFRDLSHTRSETGIEGRLPARVAEYIRKFDESLSESEHANERFAYRLIFVRKLAGKKGQADQAIEFVSPDSDDADGVPKDRWVLKETEKPKYRPWDVVRTIRAAGYSTFGINEHTELWHSLDAKNPAYGYGVEVSGQWYWYDRWVDRVKEECHRRAEQRAARPRIG